MAAAFRATLEELNEADLLLHIVDITHANAAEQCQTVEDMLVNLKISDKPRINALNKMDLFLESEESGESVIDQLAQQLKMESQGTILISAAKGWGLTRLLEQVSKSLVMSRA